jgi:hypothetical protein
MRAQKGHPVSAATLAPEIAHAFKGMQIDSAGKMSFYFHFNPASTGALLSEVDAQIAAFFIEAKFDAERTSFGIINGGSGPFQITYTINF